MLNHPCLSGACFLERACMAKVPIFSHLSPGERRELAQIITDRHFAKGEIIFRAGATEKRLYVINQGQVKITRISEAGKEQIIRILQPGDFMGELSLFTSTPANSNAEALEPTDVCMVEGPRLGEILLKVPGMAVKIIEELSHRLHSAENLIEALGLQNVEQRLAEMLLRLSQGQEAFELTISKKDLAAHLGMSQETLSRKLAFFQEQGWIKQRGQRKIYLQDRVKLMTLSGVLKPV